MAQTRQQKVLNAIRKAFCEEGDNEPSLNLLTQDAFNRTWAHLADPDDGDRFSPAEVFEHLMELTRGRGGASPIIRTQYSGARLEWVGKSSAATGGGR